MFPNFPDSRSTFSPFFQARFPATVFVPQIFTGVEIRSEIHTKKHKILKAALKAIISENLRFWKATWKQVDTKIDAGIDVIFKRRFFEKTLFFLKKNMLF